jgi:hypothetical protein
MFLKRLRVVRNMPPFHVVKAAPDSQPRGGGNTQFGRRLALLKVNNRGFTQIHNVLIITDGDGNNDAAFANVCDQLAASGFAAPPTPLVASEGMPAITIMVIDNNLESYCRAAAASTDAQVADKVSNFTAVVTNDQWPANKEGKLWLRASLAARSQRDPFVNLGSVFSDPRYHDLIPIAHQSFNDLEQLIRQLSA